MHRVAQAAEKHRVIELALADIDRQPLFDPGIRPAPDRARDFRNHPIADLDDQPGFLGALQEAGGQLDAVRRVVPAQQRLGRDDAAVGERHLRLIDQGELPTLDRAAQVDLKLGAVGELSCELVGELFGATAAAGLCMIHRRVGGAHQIV